MSKAFASIFQSRFSNWVEHNSFVQQGRISGFVRRGRAGETIGGGLEQAVPAASRMFLFSPTALSGVTAPIVEMGFDRTSPVC
jgi:hypothetical protein